MTEQYDNRMTNLVLLTDLYQLTMAYGYWKLGRADHHAAFHLFFRRHPFEGGYTVAAGLADAVDFLRAFRYSEEDLAYLATLTGNDDKPLFDRAFLDYLRDLELACDVDAVPEGTVVFPNEPMVRVTGPILQCQLLETPLLNLMNFQSLIATKAARVVEAARGEPVLEFGLRRAQGIDGGLTASRAAYIGGCAATSNVLAGMRLGIPVKGTHAHSWVMSFDDELAAFEGYAEAMPNNCVFLVDTYDTIDGVRHAITAGRKLRERGREMVGIRLDSGDLAYLSIVARRMLDDAGFPDAVIVVSNELDEHVIANLKQQDAKVAVWAVGTSLVTGGDQGALGGVYKLTAMREGDGTWRPKVKLSEQLAKTTTPGVLQVRRFRGDDRFVADMIYDTTLGVDQPITIVDPRDPTRRRTIRASLVHEDLLVPVMRNGSVVYDPPALDTIRNRAKQQLAMLHPGIRRFVNPHQYPVGLERQLFDLRADLIHAARHTVGAGLDA